MAKKNKEFNFKLYGISVFIVIAAALVIITATTFKSKYTAFNPQEVAKSYVSTIVSSGDGYNAYKNTLVSKSSKYGDYIRKYYMYPIIYKEAGYTVETGKDGLKGYNDKEYKGEKTLNDDGSLQGQLIEKMYPIYEKLINENGWDNYDLIFTSYFDELVKMRKEIFEDDYISDEIMFTALEANVKTYGETLTGTEDAFDENTGLQTSFKTTGKYQTAYGENYVFSIDVKDDAPLDIEIYKENCDSEIFSSYGVSINDISDIKSFTVNVTDETGNVLTSADVLTVKIGMSWYVDNIQTETKALYNFFEA